MNENQIQQGDVILRRITQIPATATIKQRGGRIVLAEGQATGHAHVVVDDDATLIAEGERMLLQLEKQTVLCHEEHNPITLEPGVYEIGRVQEWDYLQQMARTVAD